MGILDRIIKSLGFGKEEEQPVATKQAGTAYPKRPPEPQSYRPSPEPTKRPESRPEPAPASRTEKPIELSVRVAPTPAPVPAAVKHPEPVKTEPEYTQQPVTTYEAHLVEEENYPTILESLESDANEMETGYQPHQGPGPGQFITMDDLAETIQSSTPSPMPGSAAVESNFFGDMVDDFDEAFDAAFNPDVQKPQQSAEAGQVEHDQAAIQDLFANIAANYARPIKNFIFELKRGTATKEWIEICRPALRSISRAAESMELAGAAKKMFDFDEALSLAQTSEERILGGEMRDLILDSYEDLIEVMPQTFVIGEEEQQREGIIINSLLKQIPDLGRVTFEKLYGAGLTSLDTLFLAKKEDLAAATGIPLWLCERICNKFYQYREELEGTPRDVAQSGYRSRLRELVTALRHYHEGFERASADEWSNPALSTEKRKFRQNRQACVLQINVVLAEMGELDLVNEIQKLSFERRIQRLEEYLENSTGMI
jgi:hypothetical protein